MGLPHPRGGVSDVREAFAIQRLSSPPAWGCFCTVQGACPGVQVFPTRVGVFLIWTHFVARRESLPHPRGGVSNMGIYDPTQFKSSLPPWGAQSQPVLFRISEVSMSPSSPSENKPYQRLFIPITRGNPAPSVRQVSLPLSGTRKTRNRRQQPEMDRRRGKSRPPARGHNRRHTSRSGNQRHA